MSEMIHEITEKKERTQRETNFTVGLLREEIQKLEKEEFVMTIPMGGEQDGR